MRRYEDAIVVRNNLAKYCEQNTLELEIWLKEGFGATDPERAVRELPPLLKESPIYYWSKDMLDAVLECSKTLPEDASFRSENLPTQIGMLIFEQVVQVIVQPAAETEAERFDLIAISWLNSTRGTVFIAWMFDFDNHSPYPMIFATKDYEQVVSVDTVETTKFGVSATIATWPLLCTAILFMNQKIVSHTEHKLDRAARRRLNNKDAAVQVVYLRRRDHSYSHSHSHAQAQPVEHDYQWVVRGHWRNQYYRSTRENRPLWINPYVKGNSDGPLLHSEKLFAVVR